VRAAEAQKLKGGARKPDQIVEAGTSSSWETSRRSGGSPPYDKMSAELALMLGWGRELFSSMKGLLGVIRGLSIINFEVRDVISRRCK
jgi:hypothetical protein